MLFVFMSEGQLMVALFEATMARDISHCLTVDRS
jgi:hypothetical protein